MSTLLSDIPLFKGANGSFGDIRDETNETDFDGAAAVNFIVERALAPSDRRLTLLPSAS